MMTRLRPACANAWLDLAPFETPDGPVFISEYFAQHPAIPVLSTASIFSSFPWRFACCQVPELARVQNSQTFGFFLQVEYFLIPDD